MTFDQRDTQTDAQRERLLFENLAARLKTLSARVPALARQLEGCGDLAAIDSREALATVPVLRKRELMAAQQADPPFGGHVDIEGIAGQRMFLSPGPVWEPQRPVSDPWQGARALHAAGVRHGDRVHNAFSYHQTPGGFILDESARALGCIVYPAGVGNTATQVSALRQSGATVYTGTPDYLQTLLDAAREEGEPLTTLERALVSGGALFPQQREAYREQGIAVLQCYATADLGVIAYESATAGGDVLPGMWINEGLIVEIVTPGSNEPVAAGEVGELVVTHLDPVFPLLRFATGDLSRELPAGGSAADVGESDASGRTARRIQGWMGRADQRTKVRGMFVDPEQLHGLKERHAEIARYRLEVNRVDGRDAMTLKIVTTDGAAVATEAIASTLKSLVNLGGDVVVCDALPDDGLIVDDQRDYEQNT